MKTIVRGQCLLSVLSVNTYDAATEKVLLLGTERKPVEAPAEELADGRDA